MSIDRFDGTAPWESRYGSCRVVVAGGWAGVWSEQAVRTRMYVTDIAQQAEVEAYVGAAGERMRSSR